MEGAQMPREGTLTPLRTGRRPSRWARLGTCRPHTVCTRARYTTQTPSQVSTALVRLNQWSTRCLAGKVCTGSDQVDP